MRTVGLSLAAGGVVMAMVCAVGVLAGCEEAAPVVRVRDPEDERALAAAKEEAQRRWPEFVAAVAAREPNAAYAVKAPFPVRDSAGRVTTHEHMWIQVTAIDGESITGTLDNEPTEAGTGMRLGDVVTVKLADVEDWLIGRGADNIIGGFSIPVLTESDGERR